MSGQRMSNADAAWLHMDRPTNLMVVNAVLWFEEPVDRERLKQILGRRLVDPFPRFRQRAVESRIPMRVPSWEDDSDFDLDRHIHHLALPAPGDRRALQELVGDLSVTPLDRSKPLWDMYLIDGYGDGMAILSRMHHCIADGIALARVLLSLTDEEPDAGLAPAAASSTDHPLRDTVTAPARAVADLAGAGLHEGIKVLAHPVSELTALAKRGTADAQAVGKLLFTGPDPETVFRGRLGVARKITWSVRIPLDEIKAIGHRTGTTVNDVLVAAMTGALHRYLVRRDSLVDEIRAMVPFNLRPLDEPLPRELGNRFGLVYLALPVGMTGPARRLAEVHRRMDGIKHSPEGAVSYGFLEAIGLTPAQIEQRLLDVFTAKSTAVVTNVPGPRQPVYLAGTRLAGVLGWVPTGGSTGMGVSIFSYNGGVTVGLQVDAGLVPDPETIIAAFEREVGSLAGLRGRAGVAQAR